MIVSYGDEPHEPYVAGFEAKLVNAGVAQLDTEGSGSVVVRARSEGKSLLRLLEPGTSRLLDRIEIKTAPIARVVLSPLAVVAHFQPDPWALLTSSRALLVVRLLDPDRVPLIDEGLEVSAHGAEITRQTWDLYEVSAPPSPGYVSIAVRAGGRLSLVRAQVIAPAAIDAIIEDSRSTITGEAQWDTTLCLVARSGGAMVLGAAWTFEPSRGVAFAPKQPSSRDQASGRRCVNLTGKKGTPGTIVVRASDFSKTFDLPVHA